MKKKYSKILGVVLALMLLASLFGFAATPAAAADAGWTKVSMPSAVTKVLTTPGSTLGPLEQAIDGTLYAYDSSGTTTNLYKSVNGGRTWSATKAPAGTIVAISTSPTDANVIYFATAGNVYKSVDGGASFVTLASAPVGANAITCLDVAEIGGRYIVVVGDALATAGTADVYSLDEGLPFPAWVSMGFNASFGGGSTVDAIVTVAYAPDTSVGLSIVAIGSDDAVLGATYVGMKVGGATWGGNIGNPLTAITAITTTGAIAFPSGFSIATNPSFFFGINDTANAAEGVYMFQGLVAPAKSVITALNIGAGNDVVSLDVAGAFSTGVIIAGTQGGTVLRSLNGGANWAPTPAKQPAGTLDAYVAWLYNDATQAYALVTGGAGGLFLSVDSGSVWNGISLLLTDVNAINDMSVAPDDTVFVATTALAADNSIWRYDGAYWEMVYNSAAPFGAVTMVEVSPDGLAVFAADLNASGIQRSTNNGDTWQPQITAVGGSDTVPDNILGWVVIDASTIITGASAKVCLTANNGLSWIEPAVAGNIVNFALEPGYDGSTYNDILGGGATGAVALSADGGLTWASKTPTATVALTGNVSVAFDADYTTNGTYYATGSTSGKVVRRVGTVWAQIDLQGQGALSATPAATDTAEFGLTAASGIMAGSDGTLYVTGSNATGLYLGVVGVFRCLNPTATVSAAAKNPYWEIAHEYGTTTLTAATGLWITEGSTKLWIVSSTALYHYTDTLSAQVVQLGPGDAAALASTSRATLTWEALSGAIEYQVNVNTRSDFLGTAFAAVTYYGYDILTATVGTGTTPLAANTTYYWRVRAAGNGGRVTAGLGAPVQSRWSETRSFTTLVATPGTPVNRVPANGAQNIVTTPSFAWGAVAGATYELELGTDPTFEADVTAVTLSVPYHAWTTELDYSTAYYWRVRSVTATGSTSPWITSVFTTMAEPVEQVPPVKVDEVQPADIIVEVPAAVEVVPTPTWALVLIIAIGAVLLVAVIVLIVRTRRPI